MAYKIEAQGLDAAGLGRQIQAHPGPVEVVGCLGQRFIGAGMQRKKIRVTGIPGNALGAYLNGGEIEVCANAQDAVGDTMNAGTIVIHGDVGDTVGYAMRGGEIYVEGSAGYRAGVHMKEYQDKVPVMVIGGRAGSFLGEYQAGGVILVLGLTGSGPIAGNFPCTGMHGGKVLLRCRPEELLFPGQVTALPASAQDLDAVRPYLEEFCRRFGKDLSVILNAPFTLAVPDSRNPYRQMYVAN